MHTINFTLGTTQKVLLWVLDDFEGVGNIFEQNTKGCPDLAKTKFRENIYLTVLIVTSKNYK